jgi:hypothetical protein
MSLPRAAALGTMHGKEAALAPPLARLGIALLTPEGLDTDRFGTFTGEVPRAGTMADAARAKATAAMVATGLPHGLASEGAYGPHPSLPFVAAGLELVLWRDAERGAEVVETLADDRPAYDQAEVSDAKALAPFLQRIGFPQTALVVAPSDAPGRPVAKGLRDAGTLAVAVRAAAGRSSCGRAFVQTDMRAHMNPRRMETIGRLAARLALRLATPCPSCGAPGWGRLRTEPGLPCGWCGGPSILVRHEIHGCAACGAEDIRPRADGRTKADPGCCPSCNP